MYTSWTYITSPAGNNEFSYNERIALWSAGKIFVPSLVKWSLANLEEGSEIVFEEVVNGKIVSCTWLKHFIETDYEWVPIYIVDNHNHAITFWAQHRLSVWTLERLVVVHIDQHADTKENNSEFRMQGAELDDLEIFVNEKTNVGNFITATLNNWIIDEVIQVRTDYALREFAIRNSQSVNSLIVDIDIDFRVDKEITPEHIQIIRTLIKKAKLVTIATSPYFIDQKRAIELIKEILQKPFDIS